MTLSAASAFGRRDAARGRRKENKHLPAHSHAHFIFSIIFYPFIYLYRHLRTYIFVLVEIRVFLE